MISNRNMETTHFLMTIISLIKDHLSEFKLESPVTESDCVTALSQIKSIVDDKCAFLLKEMIHNLKTEIAANIGIEKNLIMHHEESSIVKKRTQQLKQLLQEKTNFGLNLKDITNHRLPNKLYIAFHVALRRINLDTQNLNDWAEEFISIFSHALTLIFPKQKALEDYPDNHEDYCNLLNLIIHLLENNLEFFRQHSLTLFQANGEMQSIFNYLNIGEKLKDGEPILIRGTPLEQLQILAKWFKPLCDKIARNIQKNSTNLDLLATHLEKIPTSRDKLIMCIGIALREVGKLPPQDIFLILTSALFRVKTIDIETLKKQNYQLKWNIVITR